MAGEIEISDEMVEAFLALQTARIDGIERVRAGLAAVVPLIRAQVAAEHRCVTVVEEGPPEFFIDDHDMAAIGMFEPDEPVADVQAAFEAGEKGVTGQPTALVTVDLADLLTALNQRTRHSHMRPGVWDPDNRPEIANKPCVECAARGRLRAALSAVTSSEEQDRG